MAEQVQRKDAGNTRFLPAVARVLAVLESETLRGPDLSLELGLSLWMRRTGVGLFGARSELLSLRRALLATSSLDAASEPVPISARDPRTALLGLAVYVHGLLLRAAAVNRTTPRQMIETAIGALGD
jgi:hypothetical protein